MSGAKSGFRFTPKRNVMISIAAVVLLIVLVIILLRAVLTVYQPGPTDDLEISGPVFPEIKARDSLNITSWNIGFAGMSAEMDFFADGGKRRRASSATQVEANSLAILDQILAADSSVLLLQELSRDSFITRNRDVLESMQRGLGNYQFVFSPTIKIQKLILAGNMEVGKATLSQWDMQSAVRLALPTANDLPTVTVQHFNILESRLKVEDADWEWVLLNIHLAAFDSGPMRKAQLKKVVALMEKEYLAGNRVVAGGDWNLLLTDSQFPYTTDQKYLFWVKEMPEGVVPENWQWGIDLQVPTCRTLEQPFKPGVNYTCIIDGFLVTPNVVIETTKTMDLGFKNSDHHPVTVVVCSRFPE